MKRALITGIDGQDGSFLAEWLLDKGYEVHGLLRMEVNAPHNIEHLRAKLNLHYGDMATENHLCKLVGELQPDEIYNLAGQSDVAASFQIPEYTGDVTGLGVTRLLEAVHAYSPKSRVYQASSSEMFGNTPPPQNEDTPLRARSPYAAAKIYAHNMVRVYRESYGLFACAGILFNHESERRGENFVTRKISKAVARIHLGLQRRLLLGNINAQRDWGYSPDYVRAMWLMLQQPTPDDYVVGTGKTHSVATFAHLAFKVVGLDWAAYTSFNMPMLTRPADVHMLRADATKARTILGWRPTIDISQLVEIMVKHDIEEERKYANGTRFAGTGAGDAVDGRRLLAS